MKIIQHTVLHDFSYPAKLEAFIPKDDFLLFDIETTGLSHSNSEVILIGYILYDGKDYVLTQLFCENRREEIDLLHAFAKVIQEKPLFITYNGRAFDLPYTNSRFRLQGLDAQMARHSNLDLMRLVKLNQSAFKFEDFKLKTVEKFLGIEREDTISGKESVDLYFEYERTHAQALEEKILLHNYEDILYLMKCLEFIEYVDPKTLFLECPLVIPISGKPAQIVDAVCKKDKLKITVSVCNMYPSDYYDYSHPINKVYDSKTCTLQLEFPLFNLNADGVVYTFLDIDLISEGEITFDSLTYATKLDYLVMTAQEMNYPGLMKYLAYVLENL